MHDFVDNIYNVIHFEKQLTKALSYTNILIN